MVEFKVKLEDEPAVFLGEVRKMLNDFGKIILDFNKDENYLMQLADLYERILEWQDANAIPASDFFDASEIDKIMRLMFSNYKLGDSLKTLLSSVSYDFYWKYHVITIMDNNEQNNIQKNL